MRTPPIHFDRFRHDEATGPVYEEARAAASAQDISNEQLLASNMPVTAAAAFDPGIKETLWHMLMFERFGEHVYVIGPHMQGHLSRTPLTDVKALDITWPCSSFYVALPDCPWVI